MKRQVFYSFHYSPDNWRASQVRNIGKVEGNNPASDNDWEETTKTDKAITEWIASQMKLRSCIVVLIGANTSGRKWINHEIIKAWNDGKGIVGINIHNLKNSSGDQASKGSNPFYNLTVNGSRMSTIVNTYDAPYSTSTYVYDHIKENISDWVEEAIEIRNNYSES